MNRHRLEFTFGMDGLSISVEPPAEFILTPREENATAITTRTSGSLRTFKFSSNDFVMEEAAPLTGFLVEVETSENVLVCTLEQSPVADRRPNTLVGIREPAYAVKVRVDDGEAILIARTSASPLVFEVPLHGNAGS